jgi:hypothetical protein
MREGGFSSEALADPRPVAAAREIALAGPVRVGDIAAETLRPAAHLEERIVAAKAAAPAEQATANVAHELEPIARPANEAKVLAAQEAKALEPFDRAWKPEEVLDWLDRGGEMKTSQMMKLLPPGVFKQVRRALRAREAAAAASI